MKIIKKLPLAIAALSFFSSISSYAGPQDMHQLYMDNCASCHGADHGGYLAPPLNKDTLNGRSPTALRTLIMTGSFETLMPPFLGKIDDEEIRALIKHLQATPKQPNPAWTIADMKASLKVYVKDSDRSYALTGNVKLWV